MDPHRRKVSFWKVAALVLGGLGLCALAAWLWIETMASRKWSAMARRVEELKAEMLSHDGPRPLLHGEPLEGDPWDDFAWAAEQVVGKRVGVERERLAQELEGALASDAKLSSTGSIPPRIEEAAVDRMRQGCRRTKWGRSPPWMNVVSHNFGLSSRPAALLALVALNRAHALMIQGRWGESAELMLEVAQLANDVGHDGDEGLALWIHSTTGGELRGLLLSGRLSPGELAQVERDLEVLDRSLFSDERMGRKFLIDFGSSLIEHGEMIVHQVSIGVTESSASGQQDWRYGFSKRLTCATAFAWADGWVRRMGDCDRMPWSEVRRLQGEFTRDLISFPNPVALEVSSYIEPGVSVYRRGTLARLRLLRLAAHYLSTGQWAEIEDPFGAKLLHSTRDGKIKAWSVGPNGTDEGGEGDWTDSRGKDIVLEIDRKP